MALKRVFTVTLDGAYVPITAGGSKVVLRFEPGDFELPAWVQVENGALLPVKELPFKAVVIVPGG